MEVDEKLKNYDAETVLRNLMFDIDRMIKEKTEPDLILMVLKKKVKFLESKNTSFRVRWW